MKALPDDSRIKSAYLLADEFSRGFIACAPTQSLHIGSSAYLEAWHNWAGIPNPHFSNFVGKTISSRRTRGGGTHTRKVDPHGDNLGAVPGKAMIDKHDHIKWNIYRLMQYAGFPAECEPKGLFRPYAQNLDERQGMRKNEIIRPDFLLKKPTGQEIGDVKTLSHTGANYNGPKRTEPHAAVNTRARKVAKDYRRIAKAADRKWNNTPENAVGPIECRLNEFGTVLPFVFGFLGEANNAVRKLVKEMATVGARNLWRQMGQTCQNNAYGILLNKFTRTIGVAAVRANARMKLRVLGTLLGRRDDAQYHRASREEARFREAEWDNYLRHGPRGRAEYHHGSEHCI